MKIPFVLTAACTLLVLAALIVSGCISNSPGGNVTVTPVPTPSPGSPDTKNCGITTCHGLDLACGANAPEVCTMEYRLGDKCRQYAHCETGGGTCRLVTTIQFDTCKSCVEACENQTTNDPVKAFECEAKC